MIHVYPAINESKPDTFLAKLAIAETLGSPVIDIDIADGKFVKHKTVTMRSLAGKSNHRFNIHYMGYNPLKKMQDLPDNTWQYQFHYEACEKGISRMIEVNQIIERCKENNIKPVLAISPDTKVSEICELVRRVYGVHLLTVYPGKSGQELLTWVMRKVRYLKNIDAKVRVGIDGGVNSNNAKYVKLYPITYASVTSAIFETEDPKKSYRQLKRLLR